MEFNEQSDCLTRGKQSVNGADKASEQNRRNIYS